MLQLGWDSRESWRCLTVVCGWSLVTLGPAFELETLGGGFWTSTGESVTALDTVSLDLERAHVVGRSTNQVEKWSGWRHLFTMY